MKKKHHFLLLCLPILLLLTGCKGCKDTRQPDGYIFYCKIDGKEFIPKMKTDFGYKSIEAKLLNSGKQLSIHGDIETQEIGLRLIDDINVQADAYYILGPNGSKNVGTYDKDLAVGWYITDNVNNGFVKIEALDKANKLVSGTFAFQAYDSTVHDTVHITDGRFSLYYE